MAVTLIVSETASGANVSDSLAGGSTGLDLGQVTNGQFCPLIDQALNSGHQDLYIRHDAVDDPVTDVEFYIAPYSGVYGGAGANPAADFATISAYGAADAGASANNSDGLSRGIHIDMSWDVSTTNQFLPARETTGQKRIFGKSFSGKDGLSQPNAFALHVDGASYWDGSSELDASAPATGTIGISTDTALGNRAHVRLRAYLNFAATEGGIVQFDTVIGYSYTS
jgi:hypothetical protein